jgi:hypothetical protein
MWVALLAALAIAHARPELEHVRREALTVSAAADDLSARHGVDVTVIRDGVVRALREGGIRIRDVGPETGDSPHATLAIEIDAFERAGPAAEGAIAFTVRLTIRQAVMLPDRTVSRADIWSRSLVGITAPASFVETVRRGLSELVGAVGEDLGAHHPDPQGPPHERAPARSEGFAL